MGNGTSVDGRAGIAAGLVRRLVDTQFPQWAGLPVGTSGVGDPACDLVIAWTFFTGDSRRAFREAAAQDDATWARARGWAL